MNSVAVKEAKNNFTHLLHVVEAGEPIQISRHGKGVAVLSSIEDFENANDSPNFAKSFALWQKKSAAVLSNADVDAIFKTERKIENLSRAGEIEAISHLWG